MSRRAQQQLVNQRFVNIQNNKAQKGFKWGFSNKTGWDLLDLIAKLAVPLILGIATIGFGIQQANLAQQQHDNDQKIANQQRLQDQANTLDQQRQATLVTYQDNMKDLLLNRGLLTSKPSDEIRVIARIETLSAMRQLDENRNGFLIQFLKDAHLIGPYSNNIVSFVGANLSSANLRGTDLNSTDLTEATLSGADLSQATLSGADLSQANLSGADLSQATLFEATLIRAYLLNADLSHDNLAGADLAGADLSGANLSQAILSGADLSRANLNAASLLGVDLSYASLLGADLSGANLSHANLSYANLSYADLTQQQLDQVFTCKGAILPPGLTCHNTQ